MQYISLLMPPCLDCSAFHTFNVAQMFRKVNTQPKMKKPENPCKSRVFGFQNLSKGAEFIPTRQIKSQSKQFCIGNLTPFDLI